MKKLINAPDAVVREMLAGLVARAPGLALLAGHTVVVREDCATVREREVALISGGGSGHEPAHAGYVGPGMLHAAVAGDVFTSPSVDAVFAALEAACGAPGALLIVKNYTGDRLNFGLAAELGRARGLRVETIVVADDVAIADAGDARRGLAGTVFVHKIAGAAAAMGGSLADVARVAREAAQAMGTMGVALGSCTVPAAGTPSFTLGDDEIELGLGIHGEPGMLRTGMGRARDLTAELLRRIIADRGFGASDRVAVLVNDLGGTPPMELDIVTTMVLEFLSAERIAVERLWAGRYLTSLEMPGVSLTLLRVDDERLRLLDAPVLVAGWSQTSRHGVTLSRAAQPSRASSIDVELQARHEMPPAPFRRALEALAAALLANEQYLTELDQAVGDGDLGIGLARAAHAIGEQLETLPLRDYAATLAALASLVRRVVGGTSGPLYSAFLLRGAQTLAQAERIDAATWAAAFEAGCAAITALGGASTGDCTMLDALQPAAEAFAERLRAKAGVSAALEAALVAADAGAAATATMRAARGRARYLGERARSHLDPGAVAVTLWLRAVALSLKE